MQLPILRTHPVSAFDRFALWLDTLFQEKSHATRDIAVCHVDMARRDQPTKNRKSTAAINLEAQKNLRYRFHVYYVPLKIIVAIPGACPHHSARSSAQRVGSSYSNGTDSCAQLFPDAAWKTTAIWQLHSRSSSRFSEFPESSQFVDSAVFSKSPKCLHQDYWCKLVVVKRWCFRCKAGLTYFLLQCLQTLAEVCLSLHHFACVPRVVCCWKQCFTVLGTWISTSCEDRKWHIYI